MFAKETFWIAAQVCRNGRYAAHLMRVSGSDNLVRRLSNDGVDFANLFPTRKEAAAVVHQWNEGFRDNGLFLYDDKEVGAWNS